MQVWILILDPRWLSQRWCHIIMPSSKTRFSHHDVVLNDNASSCSMATLDDTGQTFRSSSDFVETIIDTDYQGSASSWSTGSKFRQSTANTWIQAVMKHFTWKIAQKERSSRWMVDQLSQHHPRTPPEKDTHQIMLHKGSRALRKFLVGSIRIATNGFKKKDAVALYRYIDILWWRNLKSFFCGMSLEDNPQTIKQRGKMKSNCDFISGKAHFTSTNIHVIIVPEFWTPVLTLCRIYSFFRCIR